MEDEKLLRMVADELEDIETLEYGVNQYAEFDMESLQLLEEITAPLAMIIR